MPAQRCGAKVRKGKLLRDLVCDVCRAEEVLMQDKNKREKCEGALQQPRPWDVAGILSVSPGRNDLLLPPIPSLKSLASFPGLA